jgi:hypothetical protein
MVAAAAAVVVVVTVITLLARAINLGMPHLLGPPSTTLGTGPPTCNPVRLRGEGVAATPPSTAASSHHCAWTDHGRPSIHTTLGADPSSTTDVRRLAAAGHFSILDALARLMGPAVVGQLL